MEIPGRIFLDTNLVNFILDYGEQIHDGMPLPYVANERVAKDVDALYNLFLTGQRASWQLAVSSITYQEVTNTSDATRRYYLENWFFEIWGYWQELITSQDDMPSSSDAERLRREILTSGILNSLPDMEDRLLIGDALAYGCDCFCTRDWRTILKHRDTLLSMPIKIVTPTEWWSLIRPYAGLWA